MQIAMLSTFFLPDSIGGVELHIAHLSRALIRQGHQVEIFHLADRNEAAPNPRVESYEGLRVHRIPVCRSSAILQDACRCFAANSRYAVLLGGARKVSYALSTFKVLKYIEAWSYTHPLDLVHQHDFLGNIVTSRLLSRRWPVILTNHSGEFLMMRRSCLLHRVLPPLMRHFRAIIGPSQELCDLGFIHPHVVAIPNGVAADEIHRISSLERQKYRHEMGLGEGEIVVLCPRRWAPTKGIIYLVRAVHRLKQQNGSPRWRILMAGSSAHMFPEYRAEIQRYIRQNGLEEEIVLLGDVPPQRMARYFQVADLVAIPSLLEATSLAALEAMAYGVPVVASEVGGLPEIIESGVSGVLVPPGDSDALAEAMRSLAEDPGLRQQLAAQAWQSVRVRYTWEAVARRTAEVYQRVLAKGSA